MTIRWMAVSFAAVACHAMALAQATGTAPVARGEAASAPATDAALARRWADEHAREDARDLEGAIRVCMDILRGHPKDPEAMNTIAGLNGKLQRFHDEITWARRALAVDAAFFRAEVNLGNAQAALGQLAPAQASFEKARQLAPKDPMPVYGLGVLAENRHDVARATALYEQAVALDPAFDSGWFNLAAMYASAQRFDDALAALDKVLALDPQARDARAMRRHVEADKAAAAR